MRKAEIASYLVSLNTLMEAQSKSMKATVSPILAAEYNIHWEMLKDKIKEEYLEARQSPDKHDGVDKDRTDQQSNQPGSSLKAGNNPRTGNGDEANDLRSGVKGSDGKSN